MDFEIEAMKKEVLETLSEMKENSTDEKMTKALTFAIVATQFLGCGCKTCLKIHENRCPRTMELWIEGNETTEAERCGLFSRKSQFNTESLFHAVQEWVSENKECEIHIDWENLTYKGRLFFIKDKDVQKPFE